MGLGSWVPRHGNVTDGKSKDVIIKTIIGHFHYIRDWLLSSAHPLNYRQTFFLTLYRCINIMCILHNITYFTCKLKLILGFIIYLFTVKYIQIKVYIVDTILDLHVSPL